MQARSERAQSGSHVPEISGRGALVRLEETFGALSSSDEFALEGGEGGRIGFGPSANDHVDGIDPLQDVQADDLTESSLQLVTLHNGATMLRYDEAYAGMMQKGSDNSELEMFEPNSLPFT